MVKVAKVKKREVSFHSRAARRGEEPAPKDLAVKAPKTETDYRPWLHSAQNAGIGKKKKVKQLTRQQKVRQQKALEKADMNVDKLERKVADSKTRAKKIQARAKDWEELNEKLEGKLVKTADSEQQPDKTSEKMEDVQVPDLEQPLPIRVADEMEPEQAVGAASAAAADEEVDEIT